MLSPTMSVNSLSPNEPMHLIEPADNWKLRHHIKPITAVKFNPDGDLFFSACKNNTDNLVVWRVATGEKIGTYNGHTGAIFCVDVDAQSQKLVSGSGDGRGNIWDIETGKLIYSCDNLVATKSVSFTPDGQKVLMCTDAILGQQPAIWVYDTKSGELIKKHQTQSIPSAINTTIDGRIIYADKLGSINLLDERTFSLLSQTKLHQAKINSLTPSFCRTYFVSSSSDFKSKIISVANQDPVVIREFLSDSPINCARATPDNRMVFCVGGTDAREVTTTKGKGNFNIEAFDCVNSKLIGHYSTHFGTINVVDVHPSGNALLSGGEDGVICLIRLDDNSFLNAPFTPFTD
ncbi:translation initiation factor 3 subunit I [Nematocida homosporus]|uniref:translation initiation factor 3 subunit I n=1 Tax=Nematocida homosporus TaxID=1912981 RepID=UPI00221F6885|nr:translation initiation factor 3 subunit I [Nematocida homosporus]KAI5187911.1 translation initiation factor 3 subunit I [Nematocida homosporus]